MSRLHVFDMDGTLLRGSACIEISRVVGVLDETLAIEEAWVRGELTDTGFWERCLPLWDGLTDADIDAAFAGTDWVGRVDAVFADIRARGESSAVITQSPEFFAERIRRWGADHTYGARVTPGSAAGAERMVSSADKLAITERLLTDLGLSRSDCIVYGDSMSDVDLFRTLTHTVAVNAKPAIRSLARVVYDGGDLWDAYLAGRRLVDAPAADEVAP